MKFVLAPTGTPDVTMSVNVTSLSRALKLHFKDSLSQPQAHFNYSGSRKALTFRLKAHFEALSRTLSYQVKHSEPKKREQ